MMARSKCSKSKAGYIDARPLTASLAKSTCNARPDHTCGSNTVLTPLKWDVCITPKADLAELHGASNFINAEAALLGRPKGRLRPTRIDCLHRIPDNHLLDVLALRTFERQKVGMGGSGTLSVTGRRRYEGL